MAGCAFPVALSNDNHTALHCLCLSQPANVGTEIQALSDNMHTHQHWVVWKHYEEILQLACRVSFSLVSKKKRKVLTKKNLV